MKSQKFKPPVFTHRPGGKVPHDAAWLNGVVNSVKTGTPDAHKRLTIAYHNVPPHVQDDLSGPIEARPSAAPITEPADVPGADDMTRKIDSTPYLTTFGHKPRAKSATVPATCGASTAQPTVDPFAKKG